MPDQKIKSLRDFIEKRVCNYCCYDGGLCAECQLRHEIVHVEQVNSLNPESTLDEVKAYCNKYYATYNRICKIFKDEEENNA